MSLEPNTEPRGYSDQEQADALGLTPDEYAAETQKIALEAAAKRPPMPSTEAQMPAMPQTQGGAANAAIDAYNLAHAPAPRPMVGFERGPDVGTPAIGQQQQAPAGPIMVPGGWRKDFLPFQKSTLAAEEESLQKHENAAVQLTDAIAKKEETAAEFYRKQAADANARQQVQQEEEAARQAQYKQEVAKYNQFVDEAGAQKVDPNRYLANQSTGSSILMGIGAALGGFVGARQGGTNSALEMLQKQIDRDVHAQEQDLATGKWKAGQKLNMLGELRAQGMDARTAANALENAQWRIAEEQAKSMMAQSESPIVQARGQEFLAGINDRRVGLKERNDEYMFQKPHMIAPAPTMSKEELGNVFVGADGQHYVARNAESRKKAAESAITYTNIAEGIDDYKAALKNISTSDRLAFKAGITTSNMSKAQTAYNHVLSPMRQAQNDGVWKKSEVEMLANTLTPPDHFTGDPEAQANMARKQAEQANMHVMKIEDAVPVQTGFKTTQTGQLATTGAYTGEQQAPLRMEMPKGAKPLGGQ